MNLTHTGLHRFFHQVSRYRKLAGLLVRRPRYRLLCGDCEFCMGACGKAVDAQSPAGREQERSSAMEG
ncbi:hypothetical protein [Akkermansia muciniphila]|jgi:hypothetical protein|uniref:hypothetical protein n=1 Tax=Akkermansia muciniphila TaxID=239935 RepID=UPI000CB72319|nr:hypothetical protein [Akkermansia muciniphila]PNC05325.1 hypothetical protein CXU21_09320 [Akkermansia muciniphila]